MNYKEDAQKCIDQAMNARGSCAGKCYSLKYGDAMVIFMWERWKEGQNDHWASTTEVTGFMRSRGFEEESQHTGYIRRCDSCAENYLYPWAVHLQVDRVANMLEHDPRCQSGAFELAILKDSIAPPTRIGTRDVCMKCITLRGLGYDQCVCAPGVKEFFTELAVPSLDLADPFPCVFCQKTGIHQCPGGEYAATVDHGAFSLRMERGEIFPGLVDAAATKGWKAIGKAAPHPFFNAAPMTFRTCPHCGLESHNGLKGSAAYDIMKRAGCILDDDDEDDGRGFKLL